jgi:hypothetical protein
VTCLAMQKDRWPLRAELRLPPVCDLRRAHSCAAFQLRCLGVAKGPVAPQKVIAQA